MYELRVHSLRKYFKTQMLGLGVQPDYVDYTMGHTADTHYDIQMKGIEFLRNIYTANDLSIQPKTRVNKVEALREIIRAWGLNPEEILTREALAEPHRTVTIDFEDRDNSQLQTLSRAFKDKIRQETTVQMCSSHGGPAGN